MSISVFSKLIYFSIFLLQCRSANLPRIFTFHFRNVTFVIIIHFNLPKMMHFNLPKIAHFNLSKMDIAISRIWHISISQVWHIAISQKRYISISGKWHISISPKLKHCSFPKMRYFNLPKMTSFNLPKMTQFNLPKMEVLKFPENEIFQSPENSKFKSSETAMVRITYFSGNIIFRKQNISISRKWDVSLTNLANSRKNILQQMARHNLRKNRLSFQLAAAYVFDEIVKQMIAGVLEEEITDTRCYLLLPAVHAACQLSIPWSN